MGRRADVGIARSEFGWRAFIRVRGVLYSKRFKPDTAITILRDWRAAKRTDVLRAELFAAPSGTFSDDVDQYLRAVRTMATYDEREQHMELWLAALGKDRTRHSITSAEIRAVLQQWRMNGRKDGETLSESSCNHRRTALMHFFSVMNGKSGANPCREVPRFREPDPTPRGLTFKQLRKVFDVMRESKTKARIMILAYTGIPRSTLMRLGPSDFDARAKTIVVPRRRKGSGTQTRVLPLLPEAVAAFRMLQRCDGWGHFSRGSLRKALHLACKTAKVPRIRPYDLRHSFGTAVYDATGDIATAQALLDHSDAKQTRRYTMKAVAKRMRSALAKTRKSFQ